MYTLNQMSVGTKCAVALIAKVVLAEPGSWLCIEEPESYLHPKAQVALFHFLREEAKSKQIVLTTHSGGIAAATPITSLHLVRRDANNDTIVEPINDATIGLVIDELGIRPSFNFEADATVFVEGIDDVPIYEAWAIKYPFKGKVQFLSCEGGSTLHYFANAKVALSKYSPGLVCVIFDGDSERTGRDAKTKERLTEQLRLPKDQIFTLEMSEIEGCLLDAPAIRRAFSSITLSEADLEARLAPFRTKRNQKKALEELFREFKLGKYDGRLGARIAEAMKTPPPFVSAIFEHINNLFANT